MNSMEDVVGDLARDGYRIESSVGGTVIASKRVSGAGTNILFGVATLVTLGLAMGFAGALATGGASGLGVVVGLAFIVLPLVVIWQWIRTASRRVR